MRHVHRVKVTCVSVVLEYYDMLFVGRWCLDHRFLPDGNLLLSDYLGAHGLLRVLLAASEHGKRDDNCNGCLFDA